MRLICLLLAAVAILPAAEKQRRVPQNAAAEDGVAEAVAFERSKDAAAARQAASTPERAIHHAAPREEDLAAAVAFERYKDTAAARQHAEEQATAKRPARSGSASRSEKTAPAAKPGQK